MLTDLSNPEKKSPPFTIHREIYSVRRGRGHLRVHRTFSVSFTVHVTVETPRAAREPGLGNPCCAALTVRILGWTRGAVPAKAKRKFAPKPNPTEFFICSTYLSGTPRSSCLFSLALLSMMNLR